MAPSEDSGVGGGTISVAVRGSKISLLGASGGLGRLKDRTVE